MSKEITIHAEDLPGADTPGMDNYGNSGSMTFKLKNLGEHELLPSEHWIEYVDMYGEFIVKFWNKWKREYEAKRGLPDEGLLQVMCDNFIEQGGQPVPPGFWIWLQWDRELFPSIDQKDHK